MSGNLKVRHRRGPIGKRLERTHSASFVIGSVRVIDFEPEPIVGNDPKELLARIQPDAAKHSPSTQAGDHALQSLDHFVGKI